MMRKLLLGHSGKKPVEIDLKTLLTTRGLVQASSGGGKSRTLRRLAEQLFGKVQTFIIDKEGEFVSLREKYGYVLVGKGGETPTDSRSAELVCHKLLGLGASAVFDLYDLKDAERHRWVRLFLDALMNAPKILWRPLIVIVDEAHRFAPERGQGESEAYGPMIDLATDGRKRGFAAIYATQRLGKLSKNASAELLNRFIGRTIEDIDVDRAADLLSVRRTDRADFEHDLKRLKPGNFWSFGQAVSTDRILVHVGPVVTTHPEPGAPGAAEKPPTPEKVKALLPKLADLPKQAEEKARTEADLRAEIRSLKAQLAIDKVSKTPAVRAKAEIKTVPALRKTDLTRMEKVAERIDAVVERAAKAIGKLDLKSASKSIRQAIEEAKGLVQNPIVARSIPPKAPVIQKRPAVAVPAPTTGDEKPLMAGERRILEILARFYPGTRTRSQLGQLTGLSPRGGTFGNYFGRLRREGFIVEDHGGSVSITEKGLGAFDGQVPEGPSGPEELLQMWRNKLVSGERKMLDALTEAFPEALSREDLGAKTGFTHTGGTFGNYLGTLRRNELVTVEGDVVRASETLCEVADAR